MKELSVTEPDKDLGPELDQLRRIRNHYMHPDRFSISGIIVKQVLLPVHTLLNTIFLPIAHFKQSFSASTIFAKQLKGLGEGALVLEKGGIYYPLIDWKIAGSVEQNGNSFCVWYAT